MRIMITGGSGLVGNALKQEIPDAFYISSKECDFTKEEDTKYIFQNLKPTKIVHLAAKVGGLKANTEQMGQFYTDNTLINTNILHYSKVYAVEKVISLLSTCIYPDKTTYPLIETQIHDGPPHETNYAYAYSKRMLDIQSRAYRQQYNCNFITAVPNNLYGKYDNFDLKNGHVIPSLIRKVWEAKINNHPSIECWGNGEALREFTYSADVAKIITFLLKHYNEPYPINIGNTKEYSIKNILYNICNILEYDGDIVWNTDMPSGQFRKPSSNRKLLDLGWRQENYTPLKKGLQETCEWVKDNYPNIRGIK